MDPDVIPKQEFTCESEDEPITKVEILEGGTDTDVHSDGPGRPDLNSEDEEDRLYAGMPEILRNQAKSRRARAKAAAERARIAAYGGSAQYTADGSYRSENSSCGSMTSNRSVTPPKGANGSLASSPTTAGNYGNKKGDKFAENDNKYYKNMSRERRLIANARERTRVHTISTAFDALRQAIPTYSYNQKLSKLAILRIASSYIKSLSAMTEEPTLLEQPEDTHKTQFSQCVGKVHSFII